MKQRLPYNINIFEPQAATEGLPPITTATIFATLPTRNPGQDGQRNLDQLIPFALVGTLVCVIIVLPMLRRGLGNKKRAEKLFLTPAQIEQLKNLTPDQIKKLRLLGTYVLRTKLGFEQCIMDNTIPDMELKTWYTMSILRFTRFDTKFSDLLNPNPVTYEDMLNNLVVVNKTIIDILMGQLN